MPVVVEEALEQPLALLLRELGGIGTQGMLDHEARAVPDQRPQLVLAHARQAETGEYVVGRGNEVGSGVDQRSVEIEDESGVAHEVGVALNVKRAGTLTAGPLDVIIGPLWLETTGRAP